MKNVKSQTASILLGLIIHILPTYSQQLSTLKDAGKQTLEEELSNKVGTTFSFYDQIDTVQILRSYSSNDGFYDFYVVDSIFDEQQNEVILKILFVPLQLLDKLSQDKTYLINSRSAYPSVLITPNDTIAVLAIDSWTNLIDLNPETGKPKRPEEPMKLAEFYRIEKLQVLE